MPPRRFRTIAAVLLLALGAAGITVARHTPLTGQATTQCNDGIDNDGDGRIDGVKAAATDPNATRTFGGQGWDVIYFLTVQLRVFPYRDGEAIDDDAATTKRVCNLAGYSTVQSLSTKGFSSCGDNWVAWWDAGQNRWIQPGGYNACSRQPFISTLVCKGKVGACQDGIDNDGDGAVDLSDNGCANVTDDSEIPHDPDCTSVATAFEKPRPCQDGIDNDGDGQTDYPADIGCESATEEDERSQCEDTLDNDGDGATDHPADFSCGDPKDNDETNPKPQCNDGADNDGDGAVDLNDFSCGGNRQKNDESAPLAQCQDSTDNDGDGAVDLNDFSCGGSRQDNDEQSPKPQCDDGTDNDGDGAADLADFSCGQNRQHNDETNPKPQCNDGADNDGDGAIDHPADFGCGGNQADSEDASKAQCQDGLDNDGDGAIDLDDFSCGQSRQHNSESSPKAHCEDGADNDGDGKIDASDPGCGGKQDNSEKGLCGDGVDNDGDTLIDFPGDGGCSNADDNDESNPPLSVDLKVNGQDSAASVEPGSTVTLSWTSSNVARCDVGTSAMLGWGSGTAIGTSGSKQVEIAESGTFGIQCAQTLTSNMGVQDSVAVNALTTQCNDKTDNDGDGIQDLADPGCSGWDDAAESDDICVSPSILVLDLQPPPYPSTPIDVTEMRALDWDVTYHSRLTLPTITEAFLKQFAVVWIQNGCGNPGTLLSTPELNAVRAYYQNKGNLILSAGDLSGKTTANANECLSRVNQIAANLGATFEGVRNETPAGCKAIQSRHGLTAGLAQVYRKAAAGLRITGAPSWGGPPLQLQGTIGQHEAFAAAGTRSQGMAILLPQQGMLRDQCSGEQGYKNLIGVLGYKEGCACAISTEAPAVSGIASVLRPTAPGWFASLRATLLGWFPGPRNASLTAATIPKHTFTCTNGKIPTVRYVQLAAAMAMQNYAGLNIYDRSSVTLTLEQGDKVYVGGNGATHLSDDEIHIKGRSTQIINYVVGGCSGSVQEQSQPVDITGLFSGIGSQRLDAEFVDTCRSKIGHSAYSLSIVNCDNGTAASSAGSAGSTRSAGSAGSARSATSSEAPWTCFLTQCNDRIDNDGDGGIDTADPGCLSARDLMEQDDITPMGDGACVMVAAGSKNVTPDTMVAKCPTGYVVTGGGWNGYGITNLPNETSRPIASGWECDRNEGNSAACIAICCSDALIDTQIVSATGKLKEGVVAQCPVGFSVVGGGFNDAGSKYDEDRSAPEQNGWRCFDDDSDTAGSTCYAVCARLENSSNTLSCTTESVSGAQSPPLHVPCPSGSFVTGGGFLDASLSDDDQDANHPSRNGWRCAEDYGDSPAVQNSACYARCCTLPALASSSAGSSVASGPCNLRQGTNVVADTCQTAKQNGLCQTPLYADITFSGGGFSAPPHVLVTPRRVPADKTGCAQGNTDHVVCRPENITKTGFRLVCSGSPVQGTCSGNDTWYVSAAADWLAIDKAGGCTAQSGHGFRPTCNTVASNGFCTNGAGYASPLAFPAAFLSAPKLLVTPEILSDQTGCTANTTDTLTCYADNVTAEGAQVACSGSPSDMGASCGSDNGRYTQGTAGWLAMPSTPTCRVEQGKATASTCNGTLSGGTCPTPFTTTVTFPTPYASAPTVIIAPSQISKAPTCQGNATGTDTVICEVVSVTASNFTARCSGSFMSDACGAGTNTNYTQGEFHYLAIDPQCSAPGAASSTSRQPSSLSRSSVAACTLNANRYATAVAGRSKVGDGYTEGGVLGPPDDVIVDFDGDADSFGYVTLLFAKDIVNMPGNDVRVYVNDFLVVEQSETFDVLANDGTRSVTLGRIAPTVDSARRSFEFDLGAAGMSRAQRITIRNTVKGAESHLGPDIDALENLTDCATSSQSSASQTPSSSSRSGSAVSSSASFASSRPSSSQSSSAPPGSSSSSRRSSAASSRAATACPADFCARGGDVFCAVTGRDCREQPYAPCFVCVETPPPTPQAPALSPELHDALAVDSECNTDEDCPTRLCTDGRCTACTDDAACGGGRDCVVFVCRDAAVRPSAPVFAPAIGCGDRHLDTGEECDDGNTSDGDGCTAECLLEHGSCGDGTIQRALGEECEPGQQSDGVLQCGPDCRLTALSSCGNGSLDPGEECDRGLQNSDAPNADCRLNCSLGRCGDGIADPLTEECDDGNRLSGDGCGSKCIAERRSGDALAAGERDNPLWWESAPHAASDTLGPPALPVQYGALPPSQYVTVVQHMPLGETGPAAVAVMAAGAAAGVAWIRRKPRRK